jgi:hypothetical protein
MLKSYMRSLPERIVKFLGYSLFALMPLFALLMKLVYLNRRMTYGEHIVFALHLHAIWLLVLLATTLTPKIISDWLLFAVPMYALLSMRRVYGGRWWTTLLRAGCISLLYLIAIVIALTVASVIALLF